MHKFAVGDTAHHQGRVWEVTEVAGNRVTVRCGAWPQERYTTVRADRLRFVRAGSSRSRRRAEPVFDEAAADALVTGFVERVGELSRDRAREHRQAHPALTAYHEGGHGLVAALLNCDVVRVSVDPTADGYGEQGRTDYYTLGDGHTEVEAVCLVAGRRAERLCPDWDESQGHYDGHGDDYDRARRLLGGDEGLLRAAEGQADRLLAGRAAALAQLARLLLARGSVGGDEVYALAWPEPAADDRDVLGGRAALAHAARQHGGTRNDAGPASHRAARRRAGTGVLEERVTYGPVTLR